MTRSEKRAISDECLVRPRNGLPEKGQKRDRKIRLSSPFYRLVISLSSLGPTRTNWQLTRGISDFSCLSCLSRPPTGGSTHPRCL
jgi:hypothetical protein